jgi:hypothetical protein
MTRFLSGMRTRGEARALRFLAFLLCGWIAARVMATWDPYIGSLPKHMSPPPDSSAVAMAAQVPERSWTITVPAREASTTVLSSREGAVRGIRKRPADRLPVSPMPKAASGLGADLDALRLAMIARFFPPSIGRAAAFPARPGGWTTRPPLAVAGEPGTAAPFWIQRQLSGWSLGGWLYLRQGSDGASDGIGGASQLGGSQGGLRLAYGLGDSGRLRAYGRATMAIERPRQRELAVGFAFAPVPRWPVDVAVEQRIAAGSEGRTALAAMVTGGIGDIRLPARFRLEAYAQAGVVGARRRDGFADGALVVDRGLSRDGDAPLRLGALMAGAVQPGAARVDVGPRLTLKLPDVGQGSRVSLDWRQRIAGDARPDSGAALTLAADF